MLHLYVRNGQEKSHCGIASMQMFPLTHPVCPFLQKTQSSLTMMYQEPHKGRVITLCCQEYSAFFCQHSFRMCRLNCWFFCWPLTAWESLPCSPTSYLLFLVPLWCVSIWLWGLSPSSMHRTTTQWALSTLSRVTLIHQPQRIISKWTQSIPRQTLHILFTLPVLQQQRKG